MSTQPDTKFHRVYPDNHVDDQEPEVIDCTGYDDALKASAKHHIVIANKTFRGAPRENCIDMVRGGDAIIGPNDYTQAKPGVSTLTIKGGFDGLLLRGAFGTLEWGQYSNYDRWFKLPKSRRLNFEPTATGTVIVWHGEMPKHVPAGVKVKRINPLIVWAYFFFRSIQQTISPPK